MYTAVFVNASPLFSYTTSELTYTVVFVYEVPPLYYTSSELAHELLLAFHVTPPSSIWKQAVFWWHKYLQCNNTLCIR